MISPEWSEVSATSAGPGEPEIVVGQLVGLFLVAGELALVEERLLARDRRDGDRREAGLGDPAPAPSPSAWSRAAPAAP